MRSAWTVTWTLSHARESRGLDVFKLAILGRNGIATADMWHGLRFVDGVKLLADQRDFQGMLHLRACGGPETCVCDVRKAEFNGVFFCCVRWESLFDDSVLQLDGEVGEEDER